MLLGVCYLLSGVVLRLWGVYDGCVVFVMLGCDCFALLVMMCLVVCWCVWFELSVVYCGVYGLVWFVGFACSVRVLCVVVSLGWFVLWCCCWCVWVLVYGVDVGVVLL